MVGRRAGGRNVTQHIDLSFVGRVTESMMGRWGHADRRAPTVAERARGEGVNGIQGGPVNLPLFFVSTAAAVHLAWPLRSSFVREQGTERDFEAGRHAWAKNRPMRDSLGCEMRHLLLVPSPFITDRVLFR